MSLELPDFPFDASPRADRCEKCGTADADLRFVIVRGRTRYLGCTFCDICADGLVPLVQSAVGWAAREETREPLGRMRALQENLLRGACAWAVEPDLAPKLFSLD